MPELRVGCSGFNYSGWRENFYPPALPQKKWFEYYCTVFNSVELNVTFYRLPLARTFKKWHDETPEGFVFSLKGSRFITHIKRLIEPAEPLKLFFKKAMNLKSKLEVMLWQFPPSFKVNLPRLKKFLKLLKKYPVRHTLEFRNESRITDDIVNMCAENNISLCMADWPEFIDRLPVTSDFVYIRRHGKGGNYATSYSKTELRRDAKRIKNYLKDKKDVYIYFNNDTFGYAPKNALELIRLLK